MYQTKPVDVSVAGQREQRQKPIAWLRSVRVQGEVTAIVDALNRTGWNRKHAALLLSINYRSLFYKIRQHHIVPVSQDSLLPLQGRAR